MPKLGLSKWEEIVENFYAKYSTLKAWQENNYKTVCKQGWYSVPTGRRFIFRKVRQWDGTLAYSWPSVCNYCVQSVATADVMPLVLVKLLPELLEISKEIKLINQVHDSVILDTPDVLVPVVAETCIRMFERIPELMFEHYGWDWKTPMTGEVKYGNSWGAMTSYEREPF